MPSQQPDREGFDTGANAFDYGGHWCRIGVADMPLNRTRYAQVIARSGQGGRNQPSKQLVPKEGKTPPVICSSRDEA